MAKINDLLNLEQFLAFIQECDTQTLNGTEFNIVHAVYRHIGKDTFPQIDVIAAEASVSKAAITRFIQKHGFRAYSEFRTLMSSKAAMLGYNEAVNYVRIGVPTEFQALSDYVYERMTENLDTTRKNLNQRKLEKIITMMEEAEDIIFIGDNHEIDEFYPVQIALLTSGKPAYLFRVGEARSALASRLKEGSLVVFLNLFEDLFSYIEPFFEEACKANAKTIFFVQDKYPELEKKADLVYRFGIPKSQDDGYVSLAYIADLVEKMYIFKVRS